MSQELPVNNFQWIKYTSSLMKISEKAIMKKLMKDIFFKLMFAILKNYLSFSMIYHFYLIE